MRCLVTGANGFIGRWLCEELQSKGYFVVAALREPTEGPWNQSVQHDLLGAPIEPGKLEGIDCVFHLSGKAHAVDDSVRERSGYQRINVKGTKKLLESCQQASIRRFVYFSSVKAMGEGGDVALSESDACAPQTPYGQSKLDAECLVMRGNYVPEAVILRLTMVYGPTYKGNLARMIDAISSNRFPPVKDVHNRRSMVHVDDVVKAAISASEVKDAAGKVFILTDGKEYSTRQLYEWICESLGRPVPGWAVPLFMLKVTAILGDFIGWMRGRRVQFNTDAYNKLFGSACYSSKRLHDELNYKASKNLQSSIPEILRFLRTKGHQT